jgi:hypothetical protein
MIAHDIFHVVLGDSSPFAMQGEIQELIDSGYGNYRFKLDVLHKIEFMNNLLTSPQIIIYWALSAHNFEDFGRAAIRIDGKGVCQIDVIFDDDSSEFQFNETVFSRRL